MVNVLTNNLMEIASSMITQNAKMGGYALFHNAEIYAGISHVLQIKDAAQKLEYANLKLSFIDLRLFKQLELKLYQFL